MTYRVRFTAGARADLLRLYEFLVTDDLALAHRARDAIAKATEFLQDFPFSCRKAMPDNPFLRELVIPFGHRGYVALFEIENQDTVTILALRHQRENDYH
ncbi:MAG: type II toxin-antitoxin system RelE/ParE family toxin [Deefgea sp.]